MTITELIQALTAKRDEVGDLPVNDTDGHEIIGISHDDTGRVFIEANF